MSYNELVQRVCAQQSILTSIQRASGSEKPLGLRMPTYMLTCAPYILSSCITKTEVIDVTMPPVTIEIITRPMRIQMIANTRPGTVTGLRSP